MKIKTGAGYENFVKSGLADLVANGEMMLSEAAAELGISPGRASNYLHGYIENLRDEQARNAWEMSNEGKSELGLHLEITEDNLDALTQCVRLFRLKNFKDRLGQPYLTPTFQLEWVKEILRAYINGGRLTILSPPRHGKTDLLAHFAVWLIIRNPNIRILWVGGNSTISGQSLELVKDTLEFNETLRNKFLAPGEDWKPQARSGKSWNSERFTVATREISMRSPTATAIGRNGKLLSRDADIIFTDDIDDNDSTASPTTRESTKEWWTSDLSTRKEEHTAWINIGSRQHPDDVHGWLLNKKSWSHLVFEAHDSSCLIPEHGATDAHIPEDHPKDCEVCQKHVKCVLFPQLRTYHFLQEVLKDIGTAKFQMIFQNKPQVKGLAIFIKEEIINCYNQSRGLGLDDIPVDPDSGVKYTELIGGLDPSGSGYQAAFIWAINRYTRKRYMVDLENQEGGGIKQARLTLANFFELYKVRHWVIEENLYRGGIIEDDQLKEYCAKNGITLEGHETYASNKWDKNMGVTSLSPLFKTNLIDLPYRGVEAQSKVNEFTRQLVNFSDNNTPKSRRTLYKSDLVMAAWFPEVRIKKTLKGYAEAQIQMSYSSLAYPSESIGSLYEELVG